jgi:uncharacterized protein (TIGR00266 family)
MRSHEVDYKIVGDDLQLVEIELDPGETVIAEAGAMTYMEDGITFAAKMGDGSNPEGGLLGLLGQVGRRALAGESLFLTHFTNAARGGKRKVGFAAPYPGKVVPLDLSQYGGRLVCEKSCFLCAAYGTRLSVTFRKKIGTGLFGGEGFILQTLEGDGMAFVHSGGTVIRRTLADGEVLRLDTGCLVAMTAGVEYNIERAGGLKSMLFAGEGLFLATLQGPGDVWIQTLPFARLADRILGAAGRGG